MSEQLLFDQASRLTRDLIRKAEDHFEIAIPLQEIRYDLKGKAAGMAIFPRKGRPYIRYNPLMLSNHPEAFLSQTLPHEVSHLVARFLYGSRIRPHGAEWKAIMAFYDARAERCHNYRLTNGQGRQLRRFSYACKCRQHELTSIRHNRVLKGTRYLCRSCGEPLRPLS
jgi:SprT protein